MPSASQVYMGLPSLREAKTVTLSPVVVGLPTFTEASQSLLASAVLSEGQLIVAAPPCSSTVTVKLQAPPPVSEVALTTVVPTGKNEPEAGVEETEPQLPELTGGS